MSKNDGGPAAAVTMRDYFAAAALQGLLASPIDVDCSTVDVLTHFANLSYSYADAMIEAREAK